MRNTPSKPELIYEPAEFPRAAQGPAWQPCREAMRFGCRSKSGWQSNGGPHRGHPARALPFSFDAPVPDLGQLRRLLLVGVFALYADASNEPHGTIGATVQLLAAGDLILRNDLLNGRHYGDARVLDPILAFWGDGVGVETVGQCEIDGQPYRVDVLSIDVLPGVRPTTLRFRDVGGSSSFVIFDAIFEFEVPRGCPFRSQSGGVSLQDLGSVIRLGDRLRFAQATRQLEDSIFKAEDLDEARGLTLTFLAVVTAETLEMGGPRTMHRAQLEAARELDRLETLDEIARMARRRSDALASDLFPIPEGPSARLMDEAIAIVERTFALSLSDTKVAGQLGLSRSHFRHLFRQATGQPFHRYLIALRLEKAKRLLTEQDLSVSAVAEAVGFTAMPHFSRAFARRFDVTPSSLRRNGARTSSSA